MSVKRTERVGVVLTPAEKEAVRRLSEAEGGLTMNAMIRKLVRQAARDKGMWPPAVQRSAEALHA